MILKTNIATYKIDKKGHIKRLFYNEKLKKPIITKSNKLLEIYKTEVALQKIISKRIYKHRQKLRELGLIDDFKTNRDKLLIKTQFKLLRTQLLSKKGNVCEKCGAVGKYVHHIKPKSKFPKLYLDKSNLIILCQKCHRQEHKELPDGMFK